MRRTAGVLATVALMAVLALSAFAPAAPAQAVEGYKLPSSIKSEFVKGCRQGGGTRRECRCAINTLERHYSYRAFLEMIDFVDRKGRFPSKARKLIQRCL